MSTMFLVTVDRWGSYGKEDPVKIFATFTSAEKFISEVDSHKNDSWYIVEVEFENA